MTSENVNVRITGPLRDHLIQQIGANGLYENASEYIRDLIRADIKEKEEAWRWLREKLEPGMLADDSEFVKITAEEIIAGAKKRYRTDQK